jgi:hypothetical protein
MQNLDGDLTSVTCLTQALQYYETTSSAKSQLKVRQVLHDIMHGSARVGFLTGRLSVNCPHQYRGAGTIGTSGNTMRSHKR